MRKELIYEATCKKNPDYPKVRLLCGEFQRIQTPKSTLEHWRDGVWRAAMSVKNE